MHNLAHRVPIERCISGVAVTRGVSQDSDIHPTASTHHRNHLANFSLR